MFDVFDSLLLSPFEISYSIKEKTSIVRFRLKQDIRCELDKTNDGNFKYPKGKGPHKFPKDRLYLIQKNGKNRVLDKGPVNSSKYKLTEYDKAYLKANNRTR